MNDFKNQSPWGSPPGGGGNGGFRKGPTPPNIDEVISKLQATINKFLGGGKGGAKPAATDVVEVHYKGTLIDGEQFDSSYDRNQSTTFPLNGVIKGWTEGLQLMKLGSKYKFFIHPDLAYGSMARPNIPANSLLIFDVGATNLPFSHP